MMYVKTSLAIWHHHILPWDSVRSWYIRINPRAIILVSLYVVLNVDQVGG